MADSVRSIATLLQDTADRLPHDVARITVADLLDVFHERGFGFLLFIFALPAALPLPGFGINFVVAAPLILLTTQQALGRRTVWFPERVRRKAITRRSFVAFADKARFWLRYPERVIRPRLGFVTHGLFPHLIGLCGMVMALSVLVPLPLTNTVPSMGIALMALGVLMRDGLAVLAGMAVGLAWVAMLAVVLVTVGVEGVEIVKEAIKGVV